MTPGISIARRRQISIETVLLEHHGVREADLAAALTHHYKPPYISLDERSPFAPELLIGLRDL